MLMQALMMLENLFWSYLAHLIESDMKFNSSSNYRTVELHTKIEDCQMGNRPANIYRNKYYYVLPGT